ncbi:MAG: hypothetical protein ACREMO_05850 [Gemmatimonadales bacterium]
MPEPVRLPRLKDLSPADLEQLGTTPAQAALLDTLVDGIMSHFYRAQQEQVEAFQAGADAFADVVRKTNAHVLAVVRLLTERKYVRPRDADRLKELLPIMEQSLVAQEAQDAQAAAGRARFNEVLDWIERSKNLYGTGK